MTHHLNDQDDVSVHYKCLECEENGSVSVHIEYFHGNYAELKSVVCLRHGSYRPMMWSEIKTIRGVVV